LSAAGAYDETAGMETAQAIEQVTEIFRNGLGIAVPEVDTDLIDGGFLDSLALVELVFRLEQQFEIELPLDELDVENFRTIPRIATLIEGRQGRTGG
jgi:acyl carrier protein